MHKIKDLEELYELEQQLDIPHKHRFHKKLSRKEIVQLEKNKHKVKKQKGIPCFEKLTFKLIKMLSEIGINSYIWHTSTKGSVYVRFKDRRIGSIRISDHDGKPWLKYKYNIRSDIPKFIHISEGKHDQFFIPSKEWKMVVKLIEERYSVIKRMPRSNATYVVPSFKHEKERTEKTMKL